jgi:hypothetical protein
MNGHDGASVFVADIEATCRRWSQRGATFIT